MTRFNLSEWALGHRSFVLYLMLVMMAAGVLSYQRLGREEDPAFTIRTMVVQANWPGATVGEMTGQVTDRIERKLQELSSLDDTKSYSTPGQTTIFVTLKETTRGRDVPSAWVEVRNKVNDIRTDLPQGVQGPFFDDQFGDVFDSIYAFTSDGLSFRQLRDYVERVRTEVLKIPAAGRVELLGAQDEVIYLDFSTHLASGLDIDQQAAVLQSLRAQDAVAPSGVVQAGPQRVSLRVTGGFSSEDSLRALNIRVRDRIVRLADIATITRGAVDPPQPMFRFNGEPAIGLAIGMKPGSNLVEFGHELRARLREIVSDLPIGIGVHSVSNQPAVADEAVDGYTLALLEAVIIVLGVSVLGLGLRAGLVVAIAIALVVTGTFVFMDFAGLTLQRISIGALILALGLLVDDAVTPLETMTARRTEGDSPEKAAVFAYASTALPMLAGTLAAVAGLVPIGLNGSPVGDYTFALFAVISCALLISWVVSVLFTPLLGVALLPRTVKIAAQKPSRLEVGFRRLLLSAMRWRWLTIAVAVALFAISVGGLGLMQNQFFPAADRPELLVDLTLPQDSSIAETKAQVARFETALAGDADIVRWSSYVGRGAVRFHRPLDEKLGHPYFGQIVVVARDLGARARLSDRLRQHARDEFIGIDVFVHPLDLGPPFGRPVQYRLGGPDIQTVRSLMLRFADVVAANPNVGGIVYDWNEPGKVLKLDIDQDRARQLGLTSQDIATTLNDVVGGSSITRMRDGLYLVNVVGHTGPSGRATIETIQTLQFRGRDGQSVPLPSIGTVEYELEQPLVWRRNRQPTITLQAGVAGALQPATVVAQLEPAVQEFRTQLPPGYTIEVGGSVEASGKSLRPIADAVPLMLFLMATVLMFQLQSFRKLFLVVSVAPLGLIGVVAALLAASQPLGVAALLGVLALIGIIIRNAVILVAQIDAFLVRGLAPWDAVAEATQHRLRPILLTAAATSLAMIPVAAEVFWAPAAFAMIGGLIAAAVLTLLFLPALYVTCYRIKEPAEDAKHERAWRPAVQ